MQIISENIMRIYNYVKKHGILYTIKVCYRHSMHSLFTKTLNFIYKRKSLLNIIIIESHNDFDSNGGAFYDFLIKNNYNNKYKIVWLLKNKRKNRNKYLPKNVISFYYQKPSLRKAYYICRAKFFTADNYITAKVREDQTSLYFGHGAFSLKNVRGLIKVPNSVDYMLCSSKNFEEVFADQFSVPYPSDRFLNVGFPFNDVLFDESGSELKKITEQKFEKVIIWMPTFRKGGGHNRNDSSVELPFGVPLLDTENDLIALQSLLERENVLLIIKIHPMQDSNTIKHLQGSKNILILTGETVKKLSVDNYRLIKEADALISDYSSIVNSFILLNRPIAYVLSDMGSYKLGFSVANPEEYIAGEKIYNLDELLDFIVKVKNNQDDFYDKRLQLLEKMYDYIDGESCKRIAEFMDL